MIDKQAADAINEAENNLFLNEKTRAKLIDSIRKQAADQRQRTREQEAQQELEIVKRVAGAALSLQQQIGATTNATFNAISALPALGTAVAAALNKSKESMTTALGIGQQALAGLSDAEAKRTLHALDVQQKSAMQTAKTEKEKAEITEKFEAARAAAVEKAERRKAASLAVMEAARAVASIGNPAEAAAHAAAAALYAGIAGGVVGKASAGASASTGAATGTGTALATTTADTAPTTTGGAVTINFGSGFVFGTKEQVGKQVAGSLRSLRTTGFATAGGV